MSDSSQRARQQSSQVPTDRLAAEFGKVYHRVEGTVRHVDLTLWQRELAGAAAEGWLTGMALDASVSMMEAYGNGLREGRAGPVPERLLREYATRLLPAVKYFVDRFADAERGMYLFITDGRLDDLAAVKKYTTRLKACEPAGRPSACGGSALPTQGGGCCAPLPWAEGSQAFGLKTPTPRRT